MKTSKMWLAAVPSVLALAALAFAGITYQRVRQFDAKYDCDVLAGRPPAAAPAKKTPVNRHVVQNGEDLVTIAIQYGVSPQEIRALNGFRDEDEALHAGQVIVLPANAVDENPSARPRTARNGNADAENSDAATNAPACAALVVKDIEYDGDTNVRVTFNKRPDMDVVRHYVTAEPLLEGILGFECRRRYNYKMHAYVPVLEIMGKFAYYTNVTLRIRKGLPFDDADAEVSGTLTNDVVYVFKRNDPKPFVAFADKGRYLPPCGRKALRLEAMGMMNVATEIRRVEPRNVVQLLAREERQYRRGRWYCSSADEEDTDELAGLCEAGTIRCVNRPREKETLLFPVAMKDGGPERGTFLVTVRNGDVPRWEDKGYRDHVYNPNTYRLVCLSDLGLSIRWGRDTMGVWVVSFATGVPVKGTHVEVYSSANVLLAEGDTDANGWCRLRYGAKGEPFAVVARSSSDMTFLAVRDSTIVGEACEDGIRPRYLRGGDVDAFVWTERGIYRHGEKIFAHVLVRDGACKAPKPLPITLALNDPEGETLATKTLVTDADGVFAYDGFSVPDELPSGKWTLQARLPGKNGGVLAEREIKVEEFAPPQIRVNVAADEKQHPSNFTFKVSAEHLFGAPAGHLACEGAVVFEDVPFAPAQWKGFTFGDEERGLKPCFRTLARQELDADGTCVFYAPLLIDSGRPKAAVRATGQGVAFEDGGRPATARKAIVCHYYPFYIGSNLPGWLKLSSTSPTKIDFVCVDAAGALVAKPRKLTGRLDRIDSAYAYRYDDDGDCSWTCDRIRTTIYDNVPIEIGADGRAEYALPALRCGDYVMTVEDVETGVSFGRAFYLSDWGDDLVRAPLNNPTKVTIAADKAFYRVGETPRLVVKAPFAGHALMSVMHDDVVYEEVLDLTNATSEVALRPVERTWAPNVDVAISVVQSVAASANRLAARAHGLTTVRVRPIENEVDVHVDAVVKMDAVGGGRVTVDVDAKGATAAVVTLVDEGINLLTGEPTPDPVGWFSRVRYSDVGLTLFDLYDRILPVAGSGLKASGVKTGGGFGAEMLGRVSPMPTRRFKPLVLWKEKVAIEGGKGRATFDLPEFVGEVRVTAVAYSDKATGAASVQKKVAPKLVMQPDAPRFVAPGDTFDATLTLRNRSAQAGRVHYGVEPGGAAGDVDLAAGAYTNVVLQMTAPTHPGELEVVFHSRGLGEVHQAAIPVPVRPAVAWRESAGVLRLEPGKEATLTADGAGGKFGLRVSGTPMAELASVLEWLADYPHGCLEQTVSRIFPLIAAGGILNSVTSKAAEKGEEFVAAGVARVESMIRADDFVMWPDCTYAPWDGETSLYAAHFLIAAEKAGQEVTPWVKERTLKFLGKWAMSTNGVTSAYACHTLALAGKAETDRMLRLYDDREKLDALSRARLARAFVAVRDRKRAEGLMKYALEPQSVKEAAFQTLALLDVNPDDERIPKLVAYLAAHRDKQRFAWGTTAENAHALLALGAYFQRRPIKTGGTPKVRYAATGDDGTVVSGPALGDRESKTFRAKSATVTNDGKTPAFLAWRKMELPDASSVTNEANGIFITRRFLRADGSPADMDDLARGEMLVAALSITSDVTRVIGDLVVEDLFAGAFEPVHRELAQKAFETPAGKNRVADWVMRKDVRDDRMLVFSKRFELKKDDEATFFYPVRVVSAGDFVLPGPSVEGMYDPALHARRAPGRIVVRR